MQSQIAPAELPFVAPCRNPPPSAALDWLRRGWRDLAAAPGSSLLYGALLAGLSALIAWLSYRLGLIALYLGLASGFVFLGPFLAMGLYSISFQLERARRPTLAFSLRQAREHLPDTLVLGMCLLVVLLVWARSAMIISVFLPNDAAPHWRDLMPYLGIGTMVGALFSAIVFAATAFALPMLLDRRSDAVTAVVTSINACLRNKRTAFVWAAIVVAGTVVGFATACVGFVIVMPLLGHATWHAYRATIDASAWPASDPD